MMMYVNCYDLYDLYYLLVDGDNSTLDYFGRQIYEFSLYYLI